ncbi:SGNH/GDSL hydrolase family protein, partial [Candidatus Nomurabacteria bacterium]|nr:SGNH/GDSL hydrolase family protein [Candidatus Nomurabacteria bacterium]
EETSGLPFEHVSEASSASSGSTAPEVTNSPAAPTSTPVPAEPTVTIPPEEVGEYMKFDINTFLKPYWEGSIIYNEPLMFVKNQDGTIDPAQLLYHPDEIISVRTSDLSKEYKEGTDYTVEDGKIVLTENTSIFSWAYNTYYPTMYKQGQSFGKTGGGYLMYAEGTTFTRTQVAVTYRHSWKWKGTIPERQGVRLSGTLEKLKRKEPVKVLFYGDSITVGCNSSGWSGSLMYPKVPIWPELVIQSLSIKYGNDKITYVNTAVGGTTSEWGKLNASANVAAHDPDLVVIAFGMNDGALDKYMFKSNIRSIMNTVREGSPDTEFLLVSTTLPNKEAAGFYLSQWQYESVLEELSDEMSGTAIVPMTSMHSYLLKRKRFYDMTGNNINHPNDFLARMYAQSVCEVLSE